MIGAETRVDVPNRGEAANRESGADEENQGHGHLQDDKNGLGALAAAAGAAACFFESFVEAWVRGFEGRREAEEYPGEQGNAHGEEQDASVDGDFGGARQLLRENAEGRGSGPMREEESEAAACDGQQDAFGEQLADQASVTRA